MIQSPSNSVAEARRVLQRSRMAPLLLIAAAQLASAPAAQLPLADPGPGMVQPVGIPAGEVVCEFDPQSLGGQPTMADFQHGWLYIVTGGFTPTQISQHNWFDVSSPVDPLLAATAPSAANKPHGIGFWDRYILHGGNDPFLRVYDFFSGDLVLQAESEANPLHAGAQPPHEFRTTNGYITEPSKMSVMTIDPDNLVASVVEEAVIDLNALGFKLGSLHPIGNLLVCTASNAKGVATFDIGVPTQPQLLDVLIEPGSFEIYTSMVYGTRLFACESGRGIRVYDFSDPEDLVQTGFLPLDFNDGYSPRYVTIKDGKGYVTPGALKLFEFDALSAGDPPITNEFDLEPSQPGFTGSDLTVPLGNMVFVGGSDANNYTALISLGTTRDTLGPKVEYANPVDGAVNVPPTCRIGFSMSEHIDLESMSSSTFRVRPVCPANAPAVEGVYSVRHFGVVNFSPDEPLLPNTTYEVDLFLNGMKDVVNNGLRQAHHSTFTTGAGSVAQPTATHHWKLDGNALDDVGSNDGTQGGGLTYGTGQIGQAAHFDGTASIALGSLGLGGSTFTLTAWVWIDSTTSSSQMILANSSSGSSSPGYKLFVNTAGTSDGRVHFKTSTSLIDLTASTSAGVVTADGWHWIAVTRASTQVQIYVDGCDRTASSMVLNNFPAGGPTFMGQTTNGATPLHGRLDDVRTFDHVLTLEEIRSLHTTNSHPVISAFDTNGEPVPVPTNTNVVFTVVATDPDLDPLQYSFDFGDGTLPVPSASSSATHAYALPGRYTVFARVTDGSVTTSKSLVQIVHNPLTPAKPTHSATVVYDVGHDHVWNVNSDSDSVTCLGGTSMDKRAEIRVPDEPRFLALMPDETEVWVSSAGDPKLTRIDAVDFEILGVIDMPQGSRPAGIAFAPDESAVLVALEGHGGIARVELIDLNLPIPGAMEIVPSTPFPARLRSIAITADSTRALLPRFITAFYDGQLDAGEVYDLDAATLAFGTVYF